MLIINYIFNSLFYYHVAIYAKNHMGWAGEFFPLKGVKSFEEIDHQKEKDVPLFDYQLCATTTIQQLHERDT